MSSFKLRTQNKINIDKKARVYFTCHPDDFEKFFEKLCEDIFETQDCAVYYTEDMTAVIADDEKEADFGRINMLVIPVTYKLLTTPNRAMDIDIPYALEKHIPILPIMMESGIDAIYSKPDKFGELQYLNPNSMDITEIPYKEKLKKYLESVLISDEVAKRIRAAFDAYIFLSYRKKDRKYANELMKMIHSNPECRDIAIWFDEFLIPGESFKNAIEKILSDCKLFTLLLTPQLLEKVIDEKGEESDNYIISTELPLAYKYKEEKGTDIFAVEMQKTDKEELSAIGIEDYVNFEDKTFRSRLLDAISKIVFEKNDTPEHNFLIGLAYLEGIDVEVDRSRAVEMIENAASAGLLEAINKMIDVCELGLGRPASKYDAIYWQMKKIEKLKLNIDANLDELLKASNTCGYMLMGVDDYPEAEKYLLYAKKISEDSSDDSCTLQRKHSIIATHRILGNLYEMQCNFLQSEEYYKTALEMCREIHIQTPNYKTTVSMMNIYKGLSHLNSKLGNLLADERYYKYAEEYFYLAIDLIKMEIDKSGDLQLRFYLSSLYRDLAEIYNDMKLYDKQNEYYEASIKLEYAIMKETKNPAVKEHLAMAYFMHPTNIELALRIHYVSRAYRIAEQLIEEFPENELYEAERDMFKIKLDMLMLEHISNK